MEGAPKRPANGENNKQMFGHTERPGKAMWVECWRSARPINMLFTGANIVKLSVGVHLDANQRRARTIAIRRISD